MTGATERRWSPWAPGVAAAGAVIALSVTVATAGHAAPAPSDTVLFWNDQAKRAIQETATDPFQASRALALESVAVFDTIRSIEGAPAFLARLPAPRDVNPATAAAAAAHDILCLLFPSKRAMLDTALGAALADDLDGSSKERAIAFGKVMADAVFAMRNHDGWDAPARSNEGGAPGQWRPTLPSLSSPLDPQWAELRPFALIRGNQFRPAAPPAPGTAAFREAVGTVAAVGGAGSTARTAAQAETARYWNDAVGTYSPAGHWNAIAANLVATTSLGLEAKAELFAELNVAIADAGVAIADAKYTYWFWRPITAIRAGTPGMPAIPDWTPLLDTPSHPSYISGHSGFSGAAATVLTARFGARSFTLTSDSLPGVARTFSSFQQAAEEAGMSRVYGGIHYPFDNAEGLATGRAVGNWIVTAFRHISEDRGPQIVLDRMPGSGLQSKPVLSGFALDNFLPVKTVTVRLDGGERFNLAVDEQGHFSLPRRRVGRSDVVLSATSAAGRIAMSHIGIDGEGGSTVSVPLTVQ